MRWPAARPFRFPMWERRCRHCSGHRWLRRRQMGNHRSLPTVAPGVAGPHGGPACAAGHFQLRRPSTTYPGLLAAASHRSWRPGSALSRLCSTPSRDAASPRSSRPGLAPFRRRRRWATRAAARGWTLMDSKRWCHVPGGGPGASPMAPPLHRSGRAGRRHRSFTAGASTACPTPTTSLPAGNPPLLQLP